MVSRAHPLSQDVKTTSISRRGPGQSCEPLAAFKPGAAALGREIGSNMVRHYAPAKFPSPYRAQSGKPVSCLPQRLNCQASRHPGHRIQSIEAQVKAMPGFRRSHVRHDIRTRGAVWTQS